MNELDDEIRLPPMDGLWVWVVYDHPRDFPDVFVVRPQTFDKDSLAEFKLVRWPDAWGFHTLEKAREFCAQFGLTRLDRSEADDPVIVEVWL